MNIPNEIVQGDSVAWTDLPTTDNERKLVDSSAWTLTYYLRGPSVLDATAVALSSGSWKTSISAASSAELLPGTYYWQAVVTKGLEKLTIGTGRLTLKASLVDQSENFDGRSQAKKDLEVVQAAIRALVSGGAVQEYTIANRSVRKMQMTDLLTLESRLKAQVKREEKAEKIAAGLGDPTSVYVRFK